jgi:DNA-binding NtrC family response regulator
MEAELLTKLVALGGEPPREIATRHTWAQLESRRLIETETTTLSAIEASEETLVWGAAASIRALNGMVVELARTSIPILFVGESGTGKEVYARGLHRLSGGEAGQFLKISCPGMNARHFLHEMRSALSKKSTTVLLDEIDELNPECQRHLLTFAGDNGILEGREDGGIRVISATTTDLQKEVDVGRLRRELYFRINGACLKLPPLRHRVEDIPAFTEYFLSRHAEKLKKRAPTLNQETLEVLVSYDWPGNVRELENVARKIVALGDLNLAVSDLRVARMIRPAGMNAAKFSSLKMAAKAASRQTERELILQALERTKWNRKRAARELQISYKSLLYKLKQIETPTSKSEE